MSTLRARPESGHTKPHITQRISRPHPSGPEKGVITKGVFSLEKALESLKFLDPLEFLENGRNLLCFPQSGGFSKISRISKFSRISTKWTFLKRPLFQKTPFPEPEPPVRLGLFWRKFWKNPGKTPETLSEFFLEFPSKVRLGSPKPCNSRHLKAPEHFQNSLPPNTAGDASCLSGLARASQSLSWNSQQYWGYFWESHGSAHALTELNEQLMLGAGVEWFRVAGHVNCLNPKGWA